MTNEKAISILRRLQDPEAWEPKITKDVWNALELAIKKLEEQQWIPCKTVNQCFIPELKDKGYLQVLITYFAGKGKRKQITTAWVENGRLLNKRYTKVIGFSYLPEPYKEDE